MSRRGMILFAAGWCLILLTSVANSDDEKSSHDLSYSAQPVDGAALDLIFPVQETAGAAVGAGQNAGKTKGGPEDLQGEVVDLRAAGAEIKETESEIKISLQGEILFDFDKSSLRPAAEPTLTQIAALIKKSPKATVVIDGHTDAKGSQSYNMKLSDRRAASVKTWLVAHGISSGKIRTQGYGASKPIAPNKRPNGSDDPEGRQKNRRVEITIKK